jgi:dTDP-4-amino-4,6-dideoxygalactose transaminase
MADPMGLYAGIVASLGSIIAFSETVFEYARKTAGANAEKTKLLLETTAMNTMLKDLEAKAKARKLKNTVDLIQKSQVPLELFKSALEEAEKKLRPSSNRFIKVTQRFIWDFQQGEFADIIQRIVRSNEAFSTLLKL